MKDDIKLYKHGLICGRFQPLHFGHVNLIQRALKECGIVTVCVGSAQDEINERNPFSYFERYQMIRNAFGLPLAYKPKMHIIPIKDINNPPKWAKHVLSSISLHSYSNIPVDMYYAGSESDALLFKEEGIPTQVIDRKNTKYKSGTEIRKMILNNEETWKNFVPEDNWDIVIKIKKY